MFLKNNIEYPDEGQNEELTHRMRTTRFAFKLPYFQRNFGKQKEI